MLFQDGALFDDMDVGDNVAFPMRLHTKLPEREIKERVVASGTGERVEVELRVNGSTAVWDLTTEPLLDAEGEIIGITCAAMDITVRKQFEESLRRQLEQQVAAQTGWLLESNAALGERARQLINDLDGARLARRHQQKSAQDGRAALGADV